MMRPLLPFAVTILCAATLSAQTPTIDSFSPLSGPVGDVITITGSGFNSTTENNIVRFGSVKAQVITASSSSLTVRVPKGASFAPITVTDTSSAKRLTAYSPTPFAVTFSGLQTIDEASFATRVDFSTSPGASPRGIVVADIDGDGRPDIVVSNPSSGTIGIYRNISSVGGIQSNSLAARVEYSLGSTPTGIASGDLDGDGDLDLAVTDTSGAKVYVWQNASVPGTIDTASVSSYSVGTKPFGVAIADLDGDGKPDVVTANKGGNNVSILRNTSSGGSVSFAGPTNVSTGGSSAPVDLAIADVDNNGIFEPDIITANSGNNTVTVLQNIGSMSFSVVQVTASASAGVAVADYDGDGLLDVATANSGATKISVLRNSSTFGGSITFDTKTDFEAGGNPYDVLAANIEGDGKPDLVATLSALDSIVVFRNTATSGSITAGSFASMVLLAAPTGQAGIAAADVDNDGKPDLAAANPSADGFSVFRNKAVKIEIEPNNTTDSANLLVVGETVQANHESATDIDYYKFFAFAGDTLEAFVSQYGTSNAGFTLEVFDSLGQWVSLNNRWSRSQFPSGFGVHNIFPINETRTYYISIRHPDGWGPNEIGQYRLRLERFVPSRPDLSPWPGVWRVHYNSARLQLEVSPNGLTTTTYVEWGQSPSSLTNMLPGDSRSDISVWNPDVPITGLSPNQRYYHRWTATNSMGSSTSNVNSFDTPPAPIGWEILELGNLVPQYSLYGISFPSPTTGYAVGHWNGIYKTSDEGKTWFNLFPSVNMWVEGVCFSSPTVGLVVGEGGGIFKTTDGGTTWFDKRSPHYSQHLHAVRYFGSTAIAVGEGGGIMRSTDNWETWDTVRTGPHPLLDISVINTMTAFVSGEGGTILKTVDAGATWSTVPSPSGTSGNWFWGIHFLNATTGFVAGSGMNVRKTTDGGNSWSEIQDTWDSNDITFRDANNGVIVGNGGRIFRTTDGGVTWERQSGGTYSWLKAAAFIGRMVTVVGDHGIMNYFDPAAESEPNNTIIDAMPVAFRDDIEAAIQPVGDVDYYALTLEAGDTVEVSTVALDSLSVNGILELFDGGENLLLQNDDFVPGDSVQSRIVYVTPSAGTYYARYSGSSGVSTGNYKIRFRRVSLKPLIPYAGIASIHTSTSVTLAAPVVSNNVSTTVEFEYGLTLSYGSTVQALENPISDLQLTTATADLMLDAEREYHFRVKASNAAGVAYGPDVTFITSTGTTRSEIEPNNLANQGNTIFIGDTVNAFLPSTADADYYRFQAKAGDTIEVFVRAGIMPNPYSNWGDPHLLRLQITDSTNGWNLVSNDILPHPANLHSTIIANNTGIYHIRVASRNNNLNYPSAAPDTGEPQLQPTGIALNDTASYQLRLRRFEPSAPDARFDHWFALTLHDSAVMYVEVQPNGLPTTFVLQYGQSEPFTETIAYSGAPLTGVYPVGAYVPMYPLEASMNYGARVIASNALGTDTNAVRWSGTPKPPEGWSTKPVTDRSNIGLREAVLKNEQEGIAVGSNELMRTTDGGNTWVWAQNPGVNAWSVGYANDTVATVVGWGFARTTNAGVTWTYQSNVHIDGWTGKIRFANETVGYAVGEAGGISKTTDAGITWNTVRFNSQDLYNLHILDPETVYAVGDWGTILRTLNGGASWESLSSGTTNNFYGIAFTNATTGFAVGASGMVKKTTDGGTTWSTVVVPDGNWFRDVDFRDASRGIIVGDGGVILRTTNGGSTWNRQESGTYNGFRAISYVGRRAVAVDWYGLVARFLDPYDEPEPNNTAADAFVLPYGEKLDGVISPSGDIDYYKFTAASGDTIEIKSTNRSGSNLNAYLELLNTSESVLASNDNFYPNDSSQARIAFAFSSGGTYYIRLVSASADGTGEYLLELKKTSLKPSVISLTSANVTPTGVTLSSVVAPNNLPTTVTFQWGTGGSYPNSAPGNPTSIDGQQVSLVTASRSDLTPFTRYNFRVLASNAAGSSLSDTSVFFTPRAIALAEIEPNNIADSAQFMTLSDTIAATLFPASDVDYYKFHGEAGDTVEFQAVSNNTQYWRLRMLLVDSVNYTANANPSRIQTEYFDEGWFPSEYRLWHTRVLNRTSTYYVIVSNDEGFNDGDTTSYWVHIRKFGPSTPMIQHNTWTHSNHSGVVVLSTHVAPRGLKTAVAFEYGPTSALGTTVTAYGHPHSFPSEINGSWYGQVLSPAILTLQPSSHYYVKATATNSAGTVTQSVGEFNTPPAAEGWSLIRTSEIAAGRRISFPTKDIGYLVGHMGNVFKTTDGGSSWTKTGLGLSVHDHFEGISFLNPDTGIGVGQGPRIFRTSDGGNTWAYVWEHELGFSGPLYDVKMLDANTSVAVSGDQGGRIIRTANGGVTWSVVTSTDRGLRALCFSPSRDTGYAVGDDGIALRTSDRGQSWQHISIPDSIDLRDVWLHNGMSGFAVGYPGKINRTTDAGNSWSTIESPGRGEWYNGIAFADSMNGIVVGDGATILRTHDGGSTWIFEESGTWNWLTAVAFSGHRAVINSDGGFALTSVGLLAKPTNLVASYSSPQYVNIVWNDINRETGYFVERKAGTGGTYNRIRTLSADSTSIVDTVTRGHIYYYRVRAFDAVDTSLYTVEDTAYVPLLTPSNLVAAALSKTRVQLSWENGTDARLGYIIERRTDGSFSAIDTVGDVTTYVDSSASSGTSYAYRVCSYNSEMASEYSNEGNALTPGLVTAPSNLIASYQAPNFINVSWSDNANNESGFWVEKKIGVGGTYSLLREVGQNATSTKDTVQRGRIYYYRVQGYSAADTSSFAAEDSALAPLYTPSNLAASTISSSSIGLSWQNSGDARTGYRVERKAGSGGSFAEIATLPFPEGSDNMAYTDNTAASGIRYQYRIRSYASEMNSAYSNIDSALTALSKPQNMAANPSSVTNRSIAISWSAPGGATNAWFNVDSHPTLNAPSVQVAVTGTSFILTNPPLGARWIYVALQNSEGMTDVAAYDSVQTFYDNVPPEITDQTVMPTVTITGSSVTDPATISFQAAITKPSGIASLLTPMLEYKKTNSNSVISTPFPSLNGGTVNVGNLNSLFLTVGKPNGAEYRIIASDAAGNSISTIWKSFTVFVNAPPGSDFMPPAAGSSEDITALISNYRLFSVPYELTDKKPGAFMETVDKGLGPHAKEGVNYYYWRMQRYVNATYQDYEDFKSEDALTPGTAFFLISREQKTITVGSGNLVKAQDMYSIGIPVLQGWNLIGNPFPDDLPSDSMFVDAGSITDKAYYDGTGPDGGWWKTGVQVQTLRKWEGLAINVTQITSLRFKAVPPQTNEKGISPAPVAMSAQQAIDEKQEGGWLMKFDAHRSGSPIVDVGNSIGEVPGANEGYDQFDSFQPPLIPGKSLALYFKNSDGAMSSDIRPIQTDGSAWEMKVVTGDRGSRVKLNANNVVAFPDPSLVAYLLDLDDHMAYNLRERRDVEFGSKEGIRNFKVVVGSKGFVDSVSTSVNIDLVPKFFMLYQNYPNPFNPITVIRYTVPGPALRYKVTIKIYNIVGQEVAALVEREQAAGYYELTFDAQGLSSGIYLCRIAVSGGDKESNYSQVRKMVLIK